MTFKILLSIESIDQKKVQFMKRLWLQDKCKLVAIHATIPYLVEKKLFQ